MIERDNGRRKVLDAADRSFDISLDGPCWAPDLERYIPDLDAYDVLVLSVPPISRGVYVDLLEVERLGCMVFAHGSPEPTSGDDAP